VIELPHFAAPFAFGPSGAVNVIEQNTVEEKATCVFNIASCPVGFLAHDPDFGIEDLSFATVPINTAGLVDALSEQEPRAALEATETGSPLDVSLRTIVVQVSSQGASNG
jgi:hypothetical protein